jgi:4'-phosphopantetheinyl transferase
LSIAHSEGWALAAVAKVKALGIDLEPVSREVSSAFLEEAFAKNELARCEALSNAVRVAPAVVAWVLKEAVLKAWGVGLRAPLGSFGVAPRPARTMDGRWVFPLGVEQLGPNVPPPVAERIGLLSVDLLEGFVVALAIDP